MTAKLFKKKKKNPLVWTRMGQRKNLKEFGAANQ
jgi:hypothetical protein